MTALSVRAATPGDLPLIADLIRALAEYEKLAHQVRFDEAVLGERDCARLEWSVLDWNAPAIGFYKSLGARPLDDWTVMRVDGAALASLAA